MKKTSSGFTNLDKLYWPDEGITKGDLINYYEINGALRAPVFEKPAALIEAKSQWYKR